MLLEANRESVVVRCKTSLLKNILKIPHGYSPPHGMCSTVVKQDIVVCCFLYCIGVQDVSFFIFVLPRIKLVEYACEEGFGIVGCFGEFPEEPDGWN
jgi:hypothetical protein